MVNFAEINVGEKCKKSQQEQELIFFITQYPRFLNINYINGGIYDRVMENFAQNSQMELDPDGIYDWVNIPLPNKIIAFLTLPEKKSEFVRLNKNDIHAAPIFGYTNVKLISMYYYRSIINKNIQGFTFGDLNNIIKPIKILEHKWEQLSGYQDNQWKCKKCGMIGSSFSKDPSILLPKEYITCNEKIIKNIIL